VFFWVKNWLLFSIKMSAPSTAVKILGSSLFTAIAPAVQSCDDRLSSLERSQNILMDRLTNFESKVKSVLETHTLQKKALPLLRQRSEQLKSIRKRLDKLHSTMDTMASRVRNTEEKLLRLQARQSPTTTSTGK